MATLQQNVNQAVTDFYNIKTVLNQNNANANGATAEYADKVTALSNNLITEESKDQLSLTISQDFDFVEDCIVAGKINQPLAPPNDDSIYLDLWPQTCNEFDSDNIEPGAIDLDGKSVEDSNSIRSLYIPLIPSSTYRLYFKYQGSFSEGIYCLYDEEKNYLKSDSFEINSTTVPTIYNNDAKFLRFSVDKQCSQFVLFKDNFFPIFNPTDEEIISYMQSAEIPFGYKLSITSKGKNLFHCNSTSFNNIEATKTDDDFIILNGQSNSSNGYFPLMSNLLLDVNKTYKIICEGDQFPNDVYIKFQQGLSSNQVTLLSNNSQANISLDNSVSPYCSISVHFPPITFDNFTFRIMVTLADNTDTFATYKESTKTIYMKEPLSQIEGISDYYSSKDNTIYRRVKQVRIDDTNKFYTIYDTQEGFYCASLMTFDRYYTDEDVLNEAVFNHFIATNISRLGSKEDVFWQWESPTSPVLNLYIRDSLLEHYYEDTLAQSIQSFFYHYCFGDFTQFPTVYYLTNSVRQEIPISAQDSAINIVTFDKEESDTTIQIGDRAGRAYPSKFAIKYYRPSFVTNLLKEIMDCFMNNDISEIKQTTFDNYGNLLQSYIQNAISNVIIQQLADKTISEINIPEGTEKIGGYAFYNCSSLTNITIPSSVTAIDHNSFRNCSNITSLTLPNQVTSLGASAFYGCSKLETINLPSSITTLGSSAVFVNCAKLQNVTLGSNFNANNLDLSASTLYSVDTLVAMLNALADRTGLTAYTLTLGNDNLNKLSNEQLAIATQKNWTLA